MSVWSVIRQLTSTPAREPAFGRTLAGSISSNGREPNIKRLAGDESAVASAAPPTSGALRLDLLRPPVHINGDAVAMDPWLTNGTEARRTGLRPQVCGLTQGAPGFDAQTNHNKLLAKSRATIRPAGAPMIHDRVLASQPRLGQPRCSCLHSNNVLPDRRASTRDVLAITSSPSPKWLVQRRAVV